MDEISQEFTGFHVYGMHMELFAHEVFHSYTTTVGSTINRLEFSTMVVADLLENENEEKNIHGIVSLELANQILHNQEINLQEALAAYGIHLSHEIHNEPSVLELFKVNADDKLIPPMDKRMKTFHNDAIAIKKEILSSPEVEKIYNKMIWLKNTFDDNLFPITVAQQSLDISHKNHPDLIIAKIPSTDVEWRFYTIVEALEELEKKELLHTVPRFVSGSKSVKRRDKHADLEFDSFIHKLTGLETSLFRREGINEHVQRMLYYPMKWFDEEPISQSSMFKELDLTLMRKEELLQYLFGLADVNIWTGFRMKDKIHLNPNTKFVPDKVLIHWITSFVRWLLKECIIMNYDIDEKVEGFPIINHLDEEETIQKAKSIKEKIDLTKSTNYELFDKLRREN